MKGYVKLLPEFIEGNKIQFEIPVYQRYYDWQLGNCEQLLCDLLKISKSNRHYHFFGSIVTASNNDGYNRQVIDGQQRLTTISLLLLAGIKSVYDEKLAIKDESRIDEAFEVFLQAKFCNSERKIKLVHNEKDMQSYDKVFFFVKNKDSEINLDIESKITINFKYFYDRLSASSENCSFDQLLNAIYRLQIMSIELEKHDHAQMIFESLNSTGLALTESDKIRNHILMSLPEDEQEEYFKKYWQKIEQLTHGNTSVFLRAYLSISQHLLKPVKKNEVYLSWKRYNQDYDRKAELEKMLTVAHYFHKVTQAKMDSKELSNKMSHIKNIDIDIINVFLTQFLQYADQNQLGDKEIYKVIDLVENYMARRIICGLPGNALTNIFSVLHKYVLKSFESYNKNGICLNMSYSEVLAYHILRRDGTGRLPNDSEFKEAIKTRNAYSLDTHRRIFLFERLENACGSDYRDVVYDMTNNKASIEHIMPQTLNQEWKEMLGDNYKEIKEKYLNTFANLTLSGINSELSNNPFHIKKDGYKNSVYRLTKDVYDCQKWTEVEISSRADKIVQTFLNLYPYPKSSFRPLVYTRHEVLLSDLSFDPSGRSLEGYILFGEEFLSTASLTITWKDMLVNVVKAVNQEYQDTIASLCNQNMYFKYASEADLKYFTMFDTSKYVKSDVDNKTKLNILRYLFENCGILDSELVFILKPEDEVDNLAP